MTRLVAVLLLVTVPALAAAQSGERIVKPEIRVGDSWSYRSVNVLEPGTHEHDTRVSFVDDKVILAVSTRKGDGKEFDTSWTSEWNATTTYSGFMYRPNSGLFRFPMHVGDKYSYKFEVRRPKVNTIVGHTTVTTTIIGWEDVEVPAGKFRAIKMETEGVNQPIDNSRTNPVQSTFWYVPEVRRWVKARVVTPSEIRSEELLRYKLNED